MAETVCKREGGPLPVGIRASFLRGKSASRCTAYVARISFAFLYNDSVVRLVHGSLRCRIVRRHVAVLITCHSVVATGINCCYLVVTGHFAASLRRYTESYDVDILVGLNGHVSPWIVE